MLPLYLVLQQTQVWCWAATSEMWLRYEGLPGTQCEMASFWLGAPCCPFGNQIAQCYQTAPSMRAIQDVLLFGGLTTQHLQRALTLAELKAELDARRPVMAGYQGSFGGHVVMIYGYDTQDRIMIHDPYYGTFLVPYAQTMSYAGTMLWSDTLYAGVKR